MNLVSKKNVDECRNRVPCWRENLYQGDLKKMKETGKARRFDGMKREHAKRKRCFRGTMRL